MGAIHETNASIKRTWSWNVNCFVIVVLKPLSLADNTRGHLSGIVVDVVLWHTGLVTRAGVLSVLLPQQQWWPVTMLWVTSEPGAVCQCATGATPATINTTQDQWTQTAIMLPPDLDMGCVGAGVTDQAGWQRLQTLDQTVARWSPLVPITSSIKPRQPRQPRQPSEEWCVWDADRCKWLRRWRWWWCGGQCAQSELGTVRSSSGQVAGWLSSGGAAQNWPGHRHQPAEHSSAPARAAPPGAAADSVVPGAWCRIHPCVERVIEFTEKTLYKLQIACSYRGGCRQWLDSSDSNP